MALYRKWSSCRFCCAGLLPGRACGLLPCSDCTQKRRQNDQGLALWYRTRGKKLHPKRALRQRNGQGPSGYLRKTWCRMGSAGFRNDLQEKKLCSSQSGCMKQQPALFISKCLSARTSTQEECPAALCCCSTPSLDEARSWRVL